MMTLFVQKDGEFEVAEAHDILACAHELIAYDYRCGEPILDDPAKTEAFLRLHLGLKEYEVFGLLHLNTAHRLIAMEDLFCGTLDRCSVYAPIIEPAVLPAEIEQLPDLAGFAKTASIAAWHRVRFPTDARE